MGKTQRHKDTRSQVKFRTLIIICCACVMCHVSCVLFAQSVSSTELINNAKQYDGQEITYEGEVIGDIMKRGNNGWLNVHDGGSAIGVWAQVKLFASLKYTGSYKFLGDKVKVSGIFNHACPEHGGDLDIHANEISLIEAGKEAAQKVDINKRNAAIILAGGLLFIWILTQLRRR